MTEHEERRRQRKAECRKRQEDAQRAAEKRRRKKVACQRMHEHRNWCRQSIASAVYEKSLGEESGAPALSRQETCSEATKRQLAG